MIEWQVKSALPLSAEDVFDDADRLAVVALAWYVMGNEPEPVRQLAKHLRFQGEATSTAAAALKHLRSLGQGVRLTSYRLLATLAQAFPGDPYLTPERMLEVQTKLSLSSAEATGAHLAVLQARHHLPFVPEELPADVMTVTLAVLAALIYADRSLHVQELQHLKDTMTRLGLTRADLAKVKAWQDLQAMHMMASLALPYQPAVFLQAMLLTACDGNISPKEAQVLLGIRDDLALSPTLFTACVRVTQAILGQRIDHFQA